MLLHEEVWTFNHCWTGISFCTYQVDHGMGFFFVISYFIDLVLSIFLKLTYKFNIGIKWRLIFPCHITGINTILEFGISMKQVYSNILPQVPYQTITKYKPNIVWYHIQLICSSISIFVPVSYPRSRSKSRFKNQTYWVYMNPKLVKNQTQ
jgi:hypothetical protein